MDPFCVETGSLVLRGWRWPAGRPACVLLHGFGHNAAVWQRVAETLAPSFDVVAPDLRGHGDSGWAPSGAYPMGDFVSDLRRVVDGLRLECLHLVGHSLGGQVAAAFASLHPEAVEALVVIDTAPRVRGAGLSHLLETHRRAQAGHPTYERALAAWRDAYPLADAGALERAVRHGMRAARDGGVEPKTDPALARAMAPRLDAGADGDRAEAPLERAWRRIECPTLLLRGAHSSVVDKAAAQRAAFEILAEGALVEIPRSGHSVVLDNPDETAAAIAGFFAERSSR